MRERRVKHSHRVAARAGALLVEAALDQVDQGGQGRFLVGLPDGAKSGLSFGGPSLTSTESRLHRHSGSGQIRTSSHGIALASGSGAELRQPLGWVMVGGLLVSQVLTLFTTPVIYLAFDRLSRRLPGRSASGVPV